MIKPKIWYIFKYSKLENFTLTYAKQDWPQRINPSVKRRKSIIPSES